MELDEWEYLPNDHHELFNIHTNDGNIISPCSNPASVVDMNYFQTFIDQNQNNENIVVPLQLREVPVHEQESFKQEDEDDIKQSKSFEESVSKVFFKKMKESDQFVDMKMELPKSVNMVFEKKEGGFENEQDVKDENGLKMKEYDDGGDGGGGDGGCCGGGGGGGGGGLDVWKWAMSGIGAVVSFGVAAATLSLIVLGNRHKEEQYKGPKICYQIYPHEKRINEVVHHAKKLNEAIRGASLTRAHITIGGYYDGL